MPGRGTPTTWRVRTLVTVGVVAGTILALGATATATTTPPTGVGSLDAPVDAGDVVVTKGNDQSEELTHGGSATAFSLRLPEGSACPGDSANDQWRVQSFIVPATDDPGALKFLGNKPDGDGRWALYEANTETYIQVLTEQNDGAGRPGRISRVPALSFGVFSPDQLPPGNYRIGIACSLFRDVAKWWDTEIVVTADPTDEPGHFDWRLASAPADVVAGSEPSDSGFHADRLLAVGAVVLALAAVYFLIRGRAPRRAAPLSKEHR